MDRVRAVTIYRGADVRVAALTRVESFTLRGPGRCLVSVNATALGIVIDGGGARHALDTDGEPLDLEPLLAEIDGLDATR